jgi:hypothetical protein
MKRFRRNREGQFLVASALMIAILFISVTSLLSSTTLTDVDILKDDFRRDSMQIISNFRGALTLALADVSNELELRSSLTNYRNYTTLNEYPEAETYGEKLLATWHNTILQQYAGRSIKLSIVDPVFDCTWNTSEFSSRVCAVMTLDILSYGFYGLKQNVTSELTLQLLSGEQVLNEVAVTFRLQKEKGLPVTDLDPSFVRILYTKAGGIENYFVDANQSLIDLDYLGNGVYNVTFSAADIETATRIKLILCDDRGIVVAAIPENGTQVTALPDGPSDDVGPITTGVLCNPNPCVVESTTNLTATVDDTGTGANFVMAAEYFVDTVGGNGTGTQLGASDGYFDSALENVVVQIDASELSEGSHTIYVHGMDAIGNWGGFSSAVLNITEASQRMHISDVTVRALPHRWFNIYGAATVTVVDAEGKHVAGALVYGHWSGSVSGSVFGWTGTNGKVTFYSEDVFYWWGRGWHWGRLTFTFTVDDIVKSGWVYDESANVETSGTDYYP